MIKDYTYKVVGVTFRGRQKNLKSLFNKTVQGIKVDIFNSYDPCYEVELLPYEYNGNPALYVIVEGLNIGNIPADAVADVSDILAKKDPAVEVEVLLNNHTPDMYFEMLGDKDEYEDELDEIKEDPLYSAVVHLYVDDGQPAPHVPESEPPVSRKMAKLERKLLKATEKAQKKEEKRRIKEERRNRRKK
jgi:hypothetical protein